MLAYSRSGMRGFGALTSCPSADVSSLLKAVQYCNIAGVGLTACPGQDLNGIQQYNMQLQTDANNALNQCNCNNAYVENGSVGVNSCPSIYPVSGTTSITPTAPPQNTVSRSTNSTAGTARTVPSTKSSAVTQPNATSGASATDTSTNATSQQDTSGTASVGLSGLEIIIGVVGIGLAFLTLQKH